MIINAEILFLIGTLCLWVGGFLLLGAAFQAVRHFVGQNATLADLVSKVKIPLALGAVLIIASALLPTDPGRPPGTGLRIPLVWLMLSLPGWMALASWFMSIGRVIQGVIGVSHAERMAKYQAAGVWLVMGGLLWWWNIALNEPFKVLKGAIYVQPLTIFGFLILALGTVAVMAAVDKQVKSKGLATKYAVTATLVAGCVVFGFPFLWLLLTSFKEERDMVMTEGMAFVPQVTLTHPFNDPKRPLAVSEFRGRSVRATILEKLPNGKTLLEVERPYGLLGSQFEAAPGEFTPIPRPADMVTFEHKGQQAVGFIREELDSGNRLAEVLMPESLKGERVEVPQGVKPYRKPGLRWQNYSEALEWLPLESLWGLRYLQNTMVLVVLSVIGTLLSCSFVAYGFSRLSFPGRDLLFGVMLATMMLPGAVTMLPSFLIFRSVGWIDTLKPLWVPTFFAGAFNVFLINQFFKTIPMELEDAAKIDGCSYIQTYWKVMLPLIGPVMAAISIWTFMGAWNNFMGPLIYISSPENMPLAYAVQLFQGERGGSFHLTMAFGTMATIPVLILFFFAQKWFIEGVQLSGLGGR